MEKMQTTSYRPGLIDALGTLAKNGFGLLVARAELVALELSEARNHAIDLLSVYLLAALCGWFAIAFAAAIVVVLSWAALGWTILLLLMLLFGALCIGLFLKARAMLGEGRLALPETMNELRNDRDMLL